MKKITYELIFMYVCKCMLLENKLLRSSYLVRQLDVKDPFQLDDLHKKHKNL